MELLDGQPVPTKEQVLAAFGVLVAVADCIRELKEVPSGELYMRLCAMSPIVNARNYESIIGQLKGAGLISVSSHLIRWTGPAKETT